MFKLSIITAFLASSFGHKSFFENSKKFPFFILPRRPSG